MTTANTWKYAWLYTGIMALITLLLTIIAISIHLRVSSQQPALVVPVSMLSALITHYIFHKKNNRLLISKEQKWLTLQSSVLSFITATALILPLLSKAFPSVTNVSFFTPLLVVLMIGFFMSWLITFVAYSLSSEIIGRKTAKSTR